MPCPNTIVSRVADFWRQLRRSFRQRRSAGGYAAGAGQGHGPPPPSSLEKIWNIRKYAKIDFRKLLKMTHFLYLMTNIG